MYKKKKILVVIPARGGSKGIKNKNLKKIKGKSLIKILSDVLRKITIIDDILISTDSDKIFNEAKKNKIINRVFRSKKLAGDRVDDMPVLKEALLDFEIKTKKKFDYVVMTQLTSPLRKPKDVENAIIKTIEKKFDALWTISKIDLKYHPYKQLMLRQNKLKYISNRAYKIIARQQLFETFYRNGVAYIFSRKCVITKTKMPNNCGYFQINSKQISIDNLKDLKIASKYIG